MYVLNYMHWTCAAIIMIHGITLYAGLCYKDRYISVCTTIGLHNYIHWPHTRHYRQTYKPLHRSELVCLYTEIDSVAYGSPGMPHIYDAVYVAHLAVYKRPPCMCTQTQCFRLRGSVASPYIFIMMSSKNKTFIHDRVYNKHRHASSHAFIHKPIM